MEILMLWLCTSAAMDDCRVKPVSPPITHAQCEKKMELYVAVLGTGPDQNYRLVCDPVI